MTKDPQRVATIYHITDAIEEIRPLITTIENACTDGAAMYSYVVEGKITTDAQISQSSPIATELHALQKVLDKYNLNWGAFPTTTIWDMSGPNTSNMFHPYRSYCLVYPSMKLLTHQYAETPSCVLAEIRRFHTEVLGANPRPSEYYKWFREIRQGYSLSRAAKLIGAN